MPCQFLPQGYSRDTFGTTHRFSISRVSSSPQFVNGIFGSRSFGIVAFDMARSEHNGGGWMLIVVPENVGCPRTLAVAPRHSATIYVSTKPRCSLYVLKTLKRSWSVGYSGSRVHQRAQFSHSVFSRILFDSLLV